MLVNLKLALMGGDEVIRDYIAFPKSTAGGEGMIEAPSHINPAQVTELSLGITQVQPA